MRFPRASRCTWTGFPWPSRPRPSSRSPTAASAASRWTKPPSATTPPPADTSARDRGGFEPQQRSNVARNLQAPELRTLEDERVTAVVPDGGPVDTEQDNRVVP